MIEFTAWPKIARLNRTITITEKIDGTNAAVGVVEFGPGDTLEASPLACFPVVDGQRYQVYAQSRKQLIHPDRDNHGFARWVHGNAEALAALLGPGLHFGEWWGSGIQRGYGLPKGEKRFSLFNAKRWNHLNGSAVVPGKPQELGVVPVLYEGPFDLRPLGVWEVALYDLRAHGSHASPGFMNPEGIVLYHHAANLMFKVTLQDDEAPKSLADAA